MPEAKAFAASQGRRGRRTPHTNEPLCLATFNVGGTTDQTCSGPAEKAFAAKLRADIRALAKAPNHHMLMCCCQSNI